MGSSGDPELDAAIAQAADDEHLDLMRRVNAHDQAHPGEAHSTFMFLNARLTEAEFRDLVHEFRTRIEELTFAHHADDEGVRLWQVHLLAGDDTI